jgi:hypothetical protein
MTKKKRQKNKYSPVDRHTRAKSLLVAPINELRVQPIDWERDLLPEHLWLDMLFNTYVRNSALSLYKQFVESLQPYCPDGEVMYGYISDFGLIPSSRRSEYLKQNDPLIQSAFRKPIGQVMALYPTAPCSWLLNDAANNDTQDALEQLSKSIVRLLPGKDLHAGDIRVLPFRQMLKEGKLFLQQGMHIIELLPKYPEQCTEQEQYEVQQHVRIFMNNVLQRSAHYRDHDWPKYFWRRNFELSRCISFDISPAPGDEVSADEKEEIRELATNNANVCIAYLDRVADIHSYDLYDPSRDEVLLGLFSRLTRLYVMALTTPPLWAPDMAGIILRCLADTAITFAYLTKCGKAEEFTSFISYGEGKEKLLMLQLQDRYPMQKSVQGKTSEDIANELGGGFMPEMIDINLADWTKKSARDLALASGTDEIYRLVYDPASTHLHGTWMSIQKANLVRCIQPIHRFHKIPGMFEPPLYADMLDAFGKIYETAVQIGIDNLSFPPDRPSIGKVKSLVSKRASEKAEKKTKDG